VAVLIVSSRIGIVGRPGTVAMGGNEFLLCEVMKRKRATAGYIYTWTFPRHETLYWQVASEEITVSSFLHPSIQLEWKKTYVSWFLQCYKNPKNQTLARLHSAAKNLRRAHYNLEQTQLEIHPEGHEYIDDILISALIVERQRLVKRGPLQDVKDLWSWWPGE
jgi:hypothetical protein